MTQLMRTKPDPHPWEHIACLYRYGTFRTPTCLERLTTAVRNTNTSTSSTNTPPGTCEQPLLPPKRLPVSKDPFVEQIVEH